MRITDCVCAAVCAMSLTFTPAVAGRLADFQLEKLNDWSEALAVCDVTRFLLTDPDVRADVILVAGHDNSHTALYKPLYIPPNSFFSEVIHEAYENVRKAGHITPTAYSRARIHYAAQMLDAYRSASPAEKYTLMDQMDLCYHLAARAGVKLETKN